jgi:hypothetical protein
MKNRIKHPWNIYLHCSINPLTNKEAFLQLSGFLTPVTYLYGVQRDQFHTGGDDLSPRANYTNQATAALVGKVSVNFCRQRVPRGQRDRSLQPYFEISRLELLLSLPSSSSIVLTRLSGPRSRPNTSQKISSRTQTSRSVARNSDNMSYTMAVKGKMEMTQLI